MTTTKRGTTSQVTGSYVEFQAAVLRALPRDIDSEDALGWVNNGEFLAYVLHKTLTSDSSKPVGNTYPVTVNYGMSVEDAIKARPYDRGMNSDKINSRNFPTEQKVTVDVEVELIHFGRNITNNEALRELDRMGYRPAELHELLAFGEKYPDIQHEFPVLALGSVWWDPYENRNVPCLSGYYSERHLSLFWVNYGFNKFYRFAAVRK